VTIGLLGETSYMSLTLNCIYAVKIMASFYREHTAYI